MFALLSTARPIILSNIPHHLIIPPILQTTSLSSFQRKPHRFFVSTIENDLLRINQLAHSTDLRIQVIATNKREQRYEAIPRITTPITILADHDIELLSGSLSYIFSLFEDSNISTVSTRRQGSSSLVT